MYNQPFMGILKTATGFACSLRSYHHREARCSDGAARTLAQTTKLGVLGVSKSFKTLFHQFPSDGLIFPEINLSQSLYHHFSHVFPFLSFLEGYPAGSVPPLPGPRGVIDLEVLCSFEDVGLCNMMKISTSDWLVV